MANTTTKKAKENTEAVIETVEPVVEPKKLIPSEIDMHQYITVKNGFQGKLIYISPRTGEEFLWDAFGDEQEIELQELKNAKSSAKKFFTANWFMFDREWEWVIDFLGLNQYYKNALRLDEFDNVFDMSPAELKKVISGLSEGQKKSVSYRARQLIAQGAIDSLKRIAALEEALNVELIEK